MQPALTLIVPVYNDGLGIVPVIVTLFHTVDRDLRILAVYDREDDPTYPALIQLKELYPGLIPIQNSWECGGLNAVKTGLMNTATDYVGIWVSYHIDPWGKLNEMLQLMDEGYDLVSANRFAAKTQLGRGGLIKSVISACGNLVVSNMLGLPMRDISTSVKIFRKDVLDQIETETTEGFGWSVLVEWTVKMAYQGCKLKQVPFGPQNLNFLYRNSNFKIIRQMKSYTRWFVFAWKKRKTIKSRYTSLAD